MVGIADAGAPPAHLSPLPRHRGEALTRTASCPRPRPLRRTEGAHIDRHGGYRPGTRRADCSTGAPTRDVPGHLSGQGWSDRPAPASRLRCRRALAEAMLLRGAGGGGEKDRSVAPRACARGEVGNHLIDSRLTVAVRIYKQRTGMLQGVRSGRSVPSVTHPPSCSL